MFIPNQDVELLCRVSDFLPFCASHHQLRKFKVFENNLSISSFLSQKGMQVFQKNVRNCIKNPVMEYINTTLQYNQKCEVVIDGCSKVHQFSKASVSGLQNKNRNLFYLKTFNQKVQSKGLQGLDDSF